MFLRINILYIFIFRPPAIRVSDKVLIPQDEHPIINFVGLLIGPRGNTLKGTNFILFFFSICNNYIFLAMEKETGAKIIIRGKGSVKEGKVGRKDGQPLPGEDEPLHAFITASNLESVKKAVDKIKEVIKQGIEVPEGSNDLRRMQLRELAQLNGTLRETDGPRCTNCGSTDHKSWLCPDKPNVTNNIVCSSCGSAGHISKDCKQKRPGLGLGGVDGSNNQAKIDEEYMSLMAELGEVPPESQQQQPSVRETIQQSTRPYNIFDNQRHQQPRAILPAPPPPNQSNSLPPPMTSGPPPWHQNQQLICFFILFSLTKFKILFPIIIVLRHQHSCTQYHNNNHKRFIQWDSIRHHVGRSYQMLAFHLLRFHQFHPHHPT